MMLIRFSRIVLFSAIALRHSRDVDAVECGKWATSDCLGDDDKRYDPDHTSDLKELHPVWNIREGLWSATILQTGPDALPVEVEHAPPPPAGFGEVYTRFPRFGFFNLTIQGSREWYHRYIISPPAPLEFCEAPIPDGTVNVYEPGVCGVNGFSVYEEAFSVTSYEKDGSATVIGSTIKLTGGQFFPGDGTYTANPVDNTTLVISGTGAGGFFASETITFADEEGTRATSIFDIYADVPGIGRVLAWSYRQFWERLANDDAFHQAIQDAYTTHNVPMEQRVQGGQLPMQGGCLGITCPAEEDWCEYDPECSESPYQEPDATVKAGVIAGFAILGFLVIIGLLYLWHRRLMAQQAQRNRSKFARRIAETVDLTPSSRQVTPEALVKEFDRIDSQNKDGFISKEELWEFVSSGKAGDMSEKDFEALYAAIDIDNNGRVDFMEFCSFMGKCEAEFQQMKTRKSVVLSRPSMRDLAASRLASQGKEMAIPADAEEGLDEERKVEEP